MAPPCAPASPPLPPVGNVLPHPRRPSAARAVLPHPRLPSAPSSPTGAALLTGAARPRRPPRASTAGLLGRPGGGGFGGDGGGGGGGGGRPRRWDREPNQFGNEDAAEEEPAEVFDEHQSTGINSTPTGTPPSRRAAPPAAPSHEPTIPLPPPSPPPAPPPPSPPRPPSRRRRLRLHHHQPSPGVGHRRPHQCALSGRTSVVIDEANSHACVCDGTCFKREKRCTQTQTTGVRSMTFNPDGRSLLCGLHENLKVFSWEPIRCHDTVDVGWSRLSDLNVHEGKLLGCSFNQSCVGIWVVDLARLEPYATGTSTKPNGRSELRTSASSTMPLQNDSGSRANIGRSAVLQNSENNMKASTGRLSVCQISDSTPKEIKSVASSGLVPSTPQRPGTGSSTKTVGNSTFASGGIALKRSSIKNNNTSNIQNFSKTDVVPVIVPRSEAATDSRSDAADASAVLYKAGRRIESATDSSKESADVVPAVIPRTSSRMEITSDSAPVVSKVGRRLESAADSRKESADVAPVAAVPRTASRMEMASDSATVPSKTSRRVDSATDSRTENADMAPVVVPRTTSRMEMGSDSRREPSVGRVLSPFRVQSRYAELRKLNNGKVDTDKVDVGSKNETNDFNCQIFLPRRNGVILTENSEENREDVKHGTVDRLGFTSSAEPNISHRSENYVSRMRKPRDNCYIEVSRAGRTRSVGSNWEGRDQSPSSEEPTTSNSGSVAPRGRLFSSRGSNQATETPTIVSDEDVLSVLMEQHELFLSSTRSRLTKLQIVHQMWERNDIRGVIAAMEKMSDHAVSADMASVLMEKSETITLDLCTSALPVLADLLESKTDRHLGVSLELLVKLVRTFGSVIHSTVSAGPSSVGVDLQAEQRRERCNLCFIELEKVKNKLPFLSRRKGAVANTAQELSLAFQEVM